MRSRRLARPAAGGSKLRAAPPRFAALGPRLIVSLLTLSCASAARSGSDGGTAAAPGELVPAPASTRPAAPDRLPVPVLDNGKVAAGWTDLGWARHVLEPGKPALVDFSGYAGWIFSHAAPLPGTGGLVISLRVPKAYADFLAVSLGGRGGQSFPLVRTRPDQRSDLAGGWTEYWISLEELDPQAQPFDRVTLRAAGAVGETMLEVGRIGFTRTTPPSPQALAALRAPGRVVGVTLDCAAVRPISPLIYGIAYGEDASLGFTGRRWGGNNTSRYNWKLNDWSPGNDWFFRNVTGPTETSWDYYLKQNRARGLKSAWTVPMLGWVAKDAQACGFPSGLHPAQAKFDPYRPDCGNGVGPGGVELPPAPPESTGLALTPAFVEEWVRELRRLDPGPRSLEYYLLDNEPTLWNHTHRDAHPAPVTYDELLQRTIDYAAAVRRADPGVRIAGFTSWGWPALFDSAADATSSGPKLLKTDRLSHGGKALLPWWLSKLQEHERATGVRLVDAVDVHFYPQGEGIGIVTSGNTDSETAGRRIRSVRALWDPAYKDESWIAEPIKLVPRVRRWIEEEYPGLGIVIGEYNFGAEKHISGGIALAEALGRFGVLGVDAAFYWTQPVTDSIAYWAFRAFRNYDGKGGHFGDQSVAVTGGEGYESSVFASRTVDGRLVLVAVNHEEKTAMLLGVDSGSCGPASPAAAWILSDERGLQPARTEAGTERLRLPPWSVAVIELRPAPKAP